MNSAALRWTTLHVPDMDCPDELRMIREGLQSVQGVGRLHPDYLGRLLRIEHDATVVSPHDLVGRLEQIGFSAAITAGSRSRPVPVRSLSLLRRQPDLLGALSLLLASLGVFGFTDLRVLAASLATAATLIAGYPVARQAWRAARMRRIDMHVLMTLAMSGALLTGEWLEAATGMVLFRLALLIDEASKQRAHNAIHSLVQINPSVAHRFCSEAATETEDVVVEDLLLGDLVLVRPGERIPADGEIVAGSSSVNQSSITGESLPVEKQAGETVFAGSLNGEGALQVRVQHTAEQSTLARISQLIEQAQATPSPTERVVDQFARRYTPMVISVAMLLTILPPLIALIEPDWVGLTAAGSWWVFWKQWFFRALVMLIIACPCALVISTPTTILCGLHRASRLGILVKGGEFLERIGCVRWIALDKTGTVTQGRPHVVSIIPFGQDSDDRVLQLAAALEQQSEHPLAAAILREARRRKLTLLPVDDVQALRGFGVRGTVEGRSSVVGSLRYFEQQGWLQSDELPIVVEQQSGISVVAVAREDQAIGLLFLRDEPRAEAQATLQRWRELGVQQLVMLTGDHATAARQVASKLGFDEFYADLLPDDKIERVRQMARQQPDLAMIGDGVNDAPALAAAPIGLALGSGASDVALETADVAILSPHLDRVTSLIQLSRKTRRILKQNIALAIGTKALVMLLALSGHATMWMAVASDVGASLVVIFNGMRLLRPPP